MSSIDHFNAGMRRALMYVISSPEVLAPVLWLVLVAVAVLVYPAARIVYPRWKGDVDYVLRCPFDDRLQDFELVVEAPDRLIPGPQSYVLKLTSTQKQGVLGDAGHVVLTLATDAPYVLFQNNLTMPIVIEQEVTGEVPISQSLQFSVLASSHPRGPVTFVVGVRSESEEMRTSFQIPIDHVTVPMTAVLVVVAPALYAIIRFALSLSLRTHKPSHSQ